jgi:hypothetical protein
MFTPVTTLPLPEWNVPSLIDVTAGPVGGKGLEEGEDVLLRAVEGAVELDAGIAVVGVEPGEKVEVVGMDGLRGLGQAGVSRRIVVHCRILGACRSVAAVRGFLLPRPRGLISGHARRRWNFTAVSLTRAPFAGSVDRIPNPALPRKPEMGRRQRPPSHDILFVTDISCQAPQPEHQRSSR